MTRPARLALQIGLSVVLIAAVLWQADLHKIGNALRESSPGWFCAAIAINIVATFVMVVRWHLLLVARGRREPGLWWLFESYVIALLLGQILPTAVGGDAVRAIDLARRTGDGAEAVSSVVVDRVVGLAALGALAAGGALAGGSGIERGTAVALGLGVVAATALAAVALFSQRLQPLLRRLAPLAARAAGRSAPARAVPRAARVSRPPRHACAGSSSSACWRRGCAPSRSASSRRAWASISASRRCSCSVRCSSSSRWCPPR